MINLILVILLIIASSITFDLFNDGQVPGGVLVLVMFVAPCFILLLKRIGKGSSKPGTAKWDQDYEDRKRYSEWYNNEANRLDEILGVELREKVLSKRNNRK